MHISYNFQSFLMMKGKIVTKRNLTPEIEVTKSYSQSNDVGNKKYSKSFIDLMQKAMKQIKSKDKSTRKLELRNNEKCMQTFVYGLFPNQQRKLHIKSRFMARKSLDSIQTEEIQPKNTHIYEKSKIEIDINDKDKINQSLQVLNSYRMKATFNIKARKNFKTQKAKFLRRKIIKNQQDLIGNTPDRNRKISFVSDNYIQPWSINQENQQYNRYFP